MNKYFLYILKLSITLGTLYCIFILVPFTEVASAIKTTKVSYVVIGFVLILISRLLEAYQMRILTDKQGMSLSIQNIFEINTITTFYNLFVPGYMASVTIKWFRLSKLDNKPAEALASIAFSRLLNTIILIFLGLLFWSVDLRYKFNSQFGLIMLVLLAILFLIYFLFFHRRGIVFLLKSQNLINFQFIPNILKTKISKLINSIVQFHSLQNTSIFLLFLLSFGVHFLGILSCFLLALSLEINISIISIAWIRSFIDAITLLPISFSGLGIREGSHIVLLKPYNVLATMAVTYSFLLYARLLFVGGVGGLFELKNLFYYKRDKYILYKLKKYIPYF